MLWDKNYCVNKFCKLTAVNRLLSMAIQAFVSIPGNQFSKVGSAWLHFCTAREDVGFSVKISYTWFIQPIFGITWYFTNFNSPIYFVFTFADEYVSNTARKQNIGRTNHIYTKNMVPIKFVKYHRNPKNMGRMNHVYTYNIW